MKNKTGKSRLVVLFVFVTLFWCLIAGRLFVIQLVHGGEYREIASRQSTGKIAVQPERGLIYDRSGCQVAVNVIRHALYAYPTSHREIANIHNYLDRFFGQKSGTSRKRYPLRRNRFRWIDRDLSDHLAARVINDSISGLYIKKEMKRDYPFGQVGAQMLGCTDIDGRGISGLEYGYDSVLAGSPGLIDYLRDGHLNTYRIKEVPLVKPVPGNSTVLTVDWYLQEIVEEELKKAVIEHNAREGTAVFLDCASGEILAAADYVAGEKISSVKLRAAGNCLEPGSVFKIFTLAALLDNDLVDTSEVIFCENGRWRCGRRILHDDKEHDSLTVSGIFELSSNIGVGKLSLRLGGEKLSRAIRRFGFGQLCLSGIPGEQPGLISDPGVWSEFNTAALSIGHAVSVTPLQLASAVAAVANGGRLFRPSIVRGIIDPRGKLVSRIEKKFIGHALEKESADILRTLMIGVVEKGTATPARSDLVSIAGKTGTAEIPNLEKGGYFKNKFNASFLGFFPAEEPKIAGIVVLCRPEPIHYGGYTAGPAFKNIAERYSVANPDFLRLDVRMVAARNDLNMIEIPDLTNRDLSLAVKIAEKEGLSLVTGETTGVVVWQYPPPGRKIAGTDIVAAVVAGPDGPSDTMLDLTGMKLRTAMAVLEYQGLAYEINGSGIVRKQYPRPGGKIDRSLRCTLRCGKG